MTKSKETAKSKPKVLFLDIETSPIIATTFSLYPDSINHSNILQDWYIICACWKWSGNKKVESVSSLKPTEDFLVTKKLAEAIAQADIVIGHNHKKFDLKKLNSRVIFHSLPPVPSVPMVDT
jgi:DNA polymerase elongation subunit (family B)